MLKGVWIGEHLRSKETWLATGVARRRCRHRFVDMHSSMTSSCEILLAEQTRGRQVMRMPNAILIAVLIAPMLAVAQDNLGRYEDRIAVEDVMARYVWAVDSLDAEAYVAVFTEDAVIDSNGSISRGHAQIRNIV